MWLPNGRTKRVKMFDTRYGKLYHDLWKKERLPWEIYDRYFVKVYVKTPIAEMFIY